MKFYILKITHILSMVTPYAGVWIEILTVTKKNVNIYVTPYAGVWIEILGMKVYDSLRQSLPTRECGLKFIKTSNSRRNILVTPYAGVWIEIQFIIRYTISNDVTPYAGVWIEILGYISKIFENRSLPTRECGLKFSTNERTRKFCLSLPTRECGLK